MDDHLSRVADAFSRKAPLYDAFGVDHPNLARMRRRVYAHLEAVMPPTAHLLELNAGTGADAVELVRRGYTVHATDIAPGMVAEIERKIDRHDLANQLTVQQCSFTDLRHVTGGPFDGIFSNAGGLNCTPDLAPIAAQLPALLRPGSVVTWVIMPRFCPWELLTVFKDPATATRRLTGRAVASVEGVRFETTYFSARQARRAFGPAFEPIRLEGLLVTVPPADNKAFARKHPALYRLLVRLDGWLSPLPPFNHWGDFFILSLRYVP